MSSLIAPDNDFAVWAALLGIAAFGFWCERYPFGRKYSGVMLLMSLAIVLSNLKIIPTAAPAYDAVWEYIVPLAIPLLLFQADLRRVFAESGKTLVAFFIGSATVVAGVFVAVALIDLGPEENKLAGLFTGTYIGGSLNFAAVAAATQFEDDTLLSAAVAADNLITNLHIIVIVLLPGVALVQRLFPPRATSDDALSSGKPDEVHRIADLDVAGLVLAFAMAFAMAAAGKWAGDAMGRPQYAILATTLFAVLVATFGQRFVVRHLSGHNEAGNALMFIFLATIGASADLWRLIATAPILFLFALIVVGVHFVAMLAIGRLFRLGIAELCIASAVCVGGPASAPAIATAKGWRDLVVPGTLAGSFGYAIGSFIGISVWEYLRQG